MPCQYILPRTRYDNSDAMPTRLYISTWVYNSYSVPAIKLPSWILLTNWVAAVHPMPSQYILPRTRYDNPKELPSWFYISTWFHTGYSMYLMPAPPQTRFHAFFYS